MLTTLKAATRRLLSSRWSRPASRVLLSAAGLLSLALVGRFVVVGGQVPPAAAAVLEPTPATAPPPSATAPPPGPEPEADASAPPSHGARATPDDPVYLNDATVDDLRRLPGIGPKRAVAILALRRKLGHFRQIEDLLRVKGIGRRTLRKLRPLVRLAATEGGAP